LFIALKMKGLHDIRPTLSGLYSGVSGLKHDSVLRKWKSYNDDVQTLRAKYSNDCVLLGDFNAN
jgi:hypothetical protein